MTGTCDLKGLSPQPQGDIQFPGGRRFHFADPSGNQLAVWSE